MTDVLRGGGRGDQPRSYRLRPRPMIVKPSPVRVRHFTPGTEPPPLSTIAELRALEDQEREA